MRLIDRDALLAAYDAMHKGKPGRARKLIEDAPTVDGVSKAKVQELLWSGVSLDTDADKEYVCGLIDELEGLQ